MKREECVAPIPGLPCLTGLLESPLVLVSYSRGRDILCDRELAQVVADHLRLDFDLVELLARVNANNATNHLRHHNHVSQVSLDKIWLLVRLCLLLGFPQLLDETHGLALQAAVESTTGTRVNDITELF
jgi:hypothetical protein